MPFAATARFPLRPRVPHCNAFSTGVTHLLGPADDKPLQQPGPGLILCMFLAIMIVLLTSRSALGTGPEFHGHFVLTCAVFGRDY